MSNKIISVVELDEELRKCWDLLFHAKHPPLIVVQTHGSKSFLQRSLDRVHK